MELSSQNVLVVGSGKSGIAAMQLLKKAGANAMLFDANKELDVNDIKMRLEDAADMPIYLGEVPKDVDNAITLVVLSPGVPTDIEMVNTYRNRNIPIWGEIELAFAFEKGDVLAITGTNGKTTTTALLGEIMKAYFETVFVVGNIGIPYTQMVTGSVTGSVTVAEISSFQLETVHAFAPKVSAILNITPDHLNRHHTMENYAKAKQNITCNQTKEQVCVLNYEDEYLRAFEETCPAKVVYFSSLHELSDGFFCKEEEIYKAVSGKAERLMNIHDMKLLGRHNWENVMAAIAMADAYGVPMDVIIKTVCAFTAVEHRIEFVATVAGVDYYNDSKGTNPDAAIKGIEAMVKPTYLIGGGYDKQSTYDEWIESFNGKVKKLVLLGQTREKIAECAKAHGFMEYLFVESLQEAVDFCAKEAKEGEAVLLSPACASWGMFPNYEVRGQMFKDMVHALEA